MKVLMDRWNFTSARSLVYGTSNYRKFNREIGDVPVPVQRARFHGNRGSERNERTVQRNGVGSLLQVRL